MQIVVARAYPSRGQSPRQGRSSTMPTLTFGPFRLLPEQRILLADDLPVRLGSRALDILITLVEQAGQLVNKDEIVKRVWPDTVVEEASLRVHIGALRKVLGDGRDGARYITNVPGRGYCFVSPVQRLDSEHPASTVVATARPSNLPAPLTRMVGRAESVSAVAAQLSARRFVTIVGPGGIGKTTVAVAVAEGASSTYEHAVCFVDLGSLADPRLVPSELASALGIAVFSDNPLPGVLDFLSDKRMLIVLDTCEHVIEAAAALAEEILRGAPRVHVLTTSREPLRAVGEWVHRLSSLEGPPPGITSTAAEALSYPAIQLFAERSMASSDTFRLTDADVPFVVDICRRLDGIPLAIELAAATVELFGVRGLAARLNDHLALLTRGRRTALPRHQTLRATLDWSYEILPPKEKAVLRRLAGFAGGFTLDSASVVAMGEEIGAQDVVDAVTNLAAKSLIATDVGEKNVRYRLLDMTRAYALEKLRQSDESALIFHRYAGHMCERLRQAAADWETLPTGSWREIYGGHIDDVRAALTWAFSPDGDPSIGVELTAASAILWIELSLLDEHRQHLERALKSIAAGPGADPRHEMQLNAALGNALFHTVGPGPEAARAFGRALELAEQLGDTAFRLRAFSGLCAEHLVRGEYATAVAFAERFTSALGGSADPAARIIGDRLLALSLHFWGDQSRARRLAEGVVSQPVSAVHRTHNSGVQFDQRVASRTMLARILWLQGFPDQAARVAQESVDIALSIDHPISTCYTLAVAACPIALWTGDGASADRFLALLRECSIRHSLIYWQSWARGYEMLVRPRDSDAEGVRRKRGSVSAAYPLDAVGPQLETFATVSEEFAAIRARERAESSAGDWCAAELLRALAEVTLRQAGPHAAEHAETALLRSLDIARTHQTLSWELRTATSLARLRRDAGRAAEARSLLELVYDRFTEGFATTDLRNASALLKELTAQSVH